MSISEGSAESSHEPSPGPSGRPSDGAAGTVSGDRSGDLSSGAPIGASGLIAPNALPDAAPGVASAAASDAPSSALPSPPDAVDAPFSSLQSRRHQMFPSLSARDVDSVRRFATPMRFREGDMILEAGKVAGGLYVVVSGVVEIFTRDRLGHTRIVVEHGPGHFIAEMAQLSGKPALVNGRARTDADTLMVSPERLRALIIAEADLGERIMRALILRRVGLIEQGVGPTLVGAGDDPKLLQLEGFLRRNTHPYTVLDVRHDAEALELLDGVSVPPRDLPLVLCPGGAMLRAPDEGQLASCLGLVPEFDPARLYDVVIVGAGPAGLAAAVYASSEGLSVAVLDCRAPGGQAGASARIENYLGFPTGISGQALAGRAFTQAQKFGAHLAIPSEVTRVQSDWGDDTGLAQCTDDASAPPRPLRLSLRNGQSIAARSVVLASGVAYRRPAIAGFDRYDGRGVHYWASPIEARLCKDEDVVLMGGGNSAGQAVVYLSGHVKHVHLVIRAKGLESSMSRYLIDRVMSLANVTLHVGCAVQSLEGDERGLSGVVYRCAGEESDRRFAVRHLFLFVGADPRTDWLAGSGVTLDPKGFVMTCGAHNVPSAEQQAGTPAPILSNAPSSYPLQTSVRGIFAIGDVRAGSSKRVASAVGDGAAVVAQIHQYLGAMIADTPVPAVPLATSVV